MGARDLWSPAVLLAHWVEFHPQMQYVDEPYKGRAQGLRVRYGIKTHDMDYERGRVKQFEDLAVAWTKPDAGPVTLDDLPPGDEDEGIEVIQIMEAIVDNRNETHIVNAVNDGAIPNLPPDAIVEVNAVGERVRRAPDLCRTAARATGRAPAQVRRAPKADGQGGAHR